MKEEIRKIVLESGLDNLSVRIVRQKLEEALGLEADALKAKKKEISAMVDEVIAEENLGGEEEEGEEEEEEEEEKPPPKKKAKPTKKEAAEEEEAGSSSNKPKMTCRTKSGKECPKQLKSIQEKMKMTAKEFLSSPVLEVDLCGNILTGDPRQFSSGNLGWYLGGKCEMTVGKKTVWAQVGINISIPGSNSWK